MEQDVEGADESGWATHGNVLSPLHYLIARVGSTCFIVLQTSLYACRVFCHGGCSLCFGSSADKRNLVPLVGASRGFIDNGFSCSPNCLESTTDKAGYDEYLCLTRIFDLFVGGRQILVRGVKITEPEAVLTEYNLDTGIVCEAYHERWR